MYSKVSFFNTHFFFCCNSFSRHWDNFSITINKSILYFCTWINCLCFKLHISCTIIAYELMFFIVIKFNFTFHIRLKFATKCKPSCKFCICHCNKTSCKLKNTIRCSIFSLVFWNSFNNKSLISSVF